MQPTTVASQLEGAVFRYLEDAIALRGDDAADAMRRFLAGPRGVVKGPYYDVRLPFRKAVDDAPTRVLPLVPPPFAAPYAHQMRAFERLTSAHGHQPQPTLVVTGTGSGKTECFLYPLLDHCVRHRDARGVKAIVLYPMNALATDQARRFAEAWADTPAVRDAGVRIGLYVGGDGAHSTMGDGDAPHVIDKRDALRSHPPDILLTNYRMLDLLLMRPRDRGLWAHNGPHTLQYLVLDELHTYDGAQGSDVACLIRRLRARLGVAPGAMCPVGTSATIGDDGAGAARGRDALVSFARDVFGAPLLSADAVISEDRLSVDEALRDGSRALPEAVGAIPRLGDPEYDTTSLDPDTVARSMPRAEPDALAAAYVTAQVRLWFPTRTEDAEALCADPVALGTLVMRHPFLRPLLRAVEGGPVAWPTVDARLIRLDPEYAELDTLAIPERQRRRLVDSFLALVAWARAIDPASGRVVPLFSVQVQLWLREVRRLMRAVDAAPKFAWFEDVEGDRTTAWALVARCRECGTHGIAAAERDGHDGLIVNPREVGQRWLRNDRGARFVELGARAHQGMQEYLTPTLRRTFTPTAPTDTAPTDHGPDGGAPCLPVRVSGDRAEDQTKGAKPKFLARCPECGANDGLGIVGARAATIGSVAATHAFLNPYEDASVLADDGPPAKKLLAFVDSVQDASHRAGFFGARTWRFTMRTALWTALDRAGGTLPLAALGDATFDYWRDTMPRDRFVPTFTPPDLRTLATVERWRATGGKGKHERLLRDLRQRVSWEATLEAGLGCDSGQTLEATGCWSVAPDEARMAQAADALTAWLHEELPFGPPSVHIAPDAVRHFLDGLVHRLRRRGAIAHPLLDRYIQQGGKSFELSRRRNPLLSPFPYRARPPRFCTDGVGTDFERVPGKADAQTWFRDWAERAIGIGSASAGIVDLYNAAFARLDDAGVVTTVTLSKKARVWGLNPAALIVSTAATPLREDDRPRPAWVSAAQAERWQGRVTPTYRGEAKWEPVPHGDATDGATEHAADYYARLYRGGRVERIFADAHTGLLERADREALEDRFKTGSPPGATNLVVATPTLEMGIDIGDLSATMLCSVPPSTASYLQRIGRAGRKTGNALCVTLANAIPHDLYFFEAPELLLAGDVAPPGCFLDAPEMLRRQLAAHALDAWARDDDEAQIPGRLRDVLGAGGAALERFYAFVADHGDAIAASFRALFAHGEVTGEHLDALGAWTREGIPAAFRDAFKADDDEAKELGKTIRKLRENAAKLESTAAKNDEIARERDELLRNANVLQRLLSDRLDKHPLNVLTDRGALPNYAFPEPGVTLVSSVQHPTADGGSEWKPREYMRAASTAIRELAPLNTFYADGHAYRITEVDLGTKSRPLIEQWRFCDACPHTARADTPDFAVHACPRCGSPGWGDKGQRRAVVRFRGARASTHAVQSLTDDARDERQRASYDVLDLVAVDPANVHHARASEALHFGYELVQNQPLQQVNFGPSDAIQDRMAIAGSQVPGDGFVLCEECGAVRQYDPAQRAEAVRHAAWCGVRRLGRAESLVRTYLYREVRSDALRILLPVSVHGVETARPSFRAGVALGLRRVFRGDTAHLALRLSTVPAPQSASKQHFLIVYDTVPGGTGQVAELFQTDKLRAVFEEALNVVSTCSCRHDEGRDGCYRCVYAYQSQWELASISRAWVEEHFQRLLDAWPTLEKVDNLGEVPVATQLESELEERFVAVLAAQVRAEPGGRWQDQSIGGARGFRFFVAGRTWELLPQVSLGPKHRVDVPSRADFVLRCLDAQTDAPDVVLFLDGAEFHVEPHSPHSRLGLDARQRAAIAASGRLVWSMTWTDVDAANTTTLTPKGAPLFAPDLGRVAQIRPLVAPDVEPMAPDLHLRDSFALLWAWLVRPDLRAWRTTLGTAFVAACPTKAVDASGAAAVHDALAFGHLPGADPFPPATSLDGVMAVASQRDALAAAVSYPMTSLQARSLDGLRVTVRLADDANTRRDGAFGVAWREWLRLGNLAQFCGTFAMTTAAVADAGESRFVACIPVAPAAPSSDEWAEVADLIDPSCAALASALRTAGAPAPEVGYEIQADGRVDGELELAWPDVKVGVSLDDPPEAPAGWTVFPADVSPATLAAALS